MIERGGHFISSLISIAVNLSSFTSASKETRKIQKNGKPKQIKIIPNAKMSSISEPEASVIPAIEIKANRLKPKTVVKIWRMSP